MLVVLVIIGILAGAIMVASSSVLDRARVNGTRAVLQVVFEAVEEFKREQEARPTIARATGSTQDNRAYRYTDRYGHYPPDELEVFTSQGLPGWGSPPSRPGGNSLAPGRAVVAPPSLVPNPPEQWSAMRYYQSNDPTLDPIEHRELAALVVAIETLGDSSKAILDRIPDRNRTPGPLNANGNPAIFLDRAKPGEDPNGQWDPGDLQIRYIVDDWGMPISYFAVRDHTEDESQQTTDRLSSSNHPLWRQASSWFIRANRGLPVVMSYGPSGKNQLTQEAMTDMSRGGGPPAAASLVGDYADNDLDRRINHPLNADNVYIDAELKERLAEGPQ